MYIHTQFHMHTSSGLFVVPIKPKVNTIFIRSSILHDILQKNRLNKAGKFLKNDFYLPCLSGLTVVKEFSLGG
jgi:hypothetical protein